MATRWRPKTTCDCEVEYTINNSLPPDEQHGGLRCDSYVFSRKCPAHVQFTDKQLWDIIWDENPRYAFSYEAILDNIPNSLYTKRPDNGGKVLKEGITVNSNWTGTAPNRILNISIEGANISTATKNAIKNAINVKIPGGKVVFS